MEIRKVHMARLSDDFSHIIDSRGTPVDYDDPRVIHIPSDIINPLSSRIAEYAYRKHGKRCRTVGRSSDKILQYARKVCSGRECLPLVSMVGGAIKDMMEKREKNEISVYFILIQEGPCQNAAWPLIWNHYLERLGIEDVIVGVSRINTENKLGLTGRHLNDINFGNMLGELFDEAFNTIRCLARDKKKAINRFETAFNGFLNNYLEAEASLESALKKWSEDMQGISLIRNPEETPKVLIFGGLNLAFVHYPVTDYFIRQGILPKVVEASEGACFLESEGALRYGLQTGMTDPAEQFNARPDPEHPLALWARKSRISIKMVDIQLRKFRSIMESTDLMFDRHLSYYSVIQAGHPYISINSFTESTLTTGRFVKAVENGFYQGLVNLGSFNCQPAMNAQAIIRPLANQTNIPYAAIDCEGPWISTNQKRLLETVAVRAKKLAS